MIIEEKRKKVVYLEGKERDYFSRVLEILSEFLENSEDEYIIPEVGQEISMQELQSMIDLMELFVENEVFTIEEYNGRTGKEF